MDKENPPYKSGKVATVAALSVALLLIAGVYKLTEHQPVVGVNAEPVVQEYTANTEDDSDKDGVPDWKEILAGSDPYDPESVPEQSRDEKETPVDPSATTLVTQALTQQYAALQRGIGVDIFSQSLNQGFSSYISAHSQYVRVSADDIISVADTSLERTGEYRKDMQDAAAPLLSLTNAEFETYGRYVVYGDREALEELTQAADIYDSVANDMLRIAVPRDALPIHADAINSLRYFSAVLRGLVAASEDSVGSLALLSTFHAAEEGMVANFNRLGSYYAQKSSR